MLGKPNLINKQYNGNSQNAVNYCLIKKELHILQLFVDKLVLSALGNAFNRTNFRACAAVGTQFRINNSYIVLFADCFYRTFRFASTAIDAFFLIDNICHKSTSVRICAQNNRKFEKK